RLVAPPPLGHHRPHRGRTPRRRRRRPRRRPRTIRTPPTTHPLGLTAPHAPERRGQPGAGPPPPVPAHPPNRLGAVRRDRSGATVRLGATVHFRQRVGAPAGLTDAQPRDHPPAVDQGWRRPRETSPPCVRASPAPVPGQTVGRRGRNRP